MGQARANLLEQPIRADLLIEARPDTCHQAATDLDVSPLPLADRLLQKPKREQRSRIFGVRISSCSVSGEAGLTCPLFSATPVESPAGSARLKVNS